MPTAPAIMMYPAGRRAGDCFRNLRNGENGGMRIQL